MSVPDVLAGLPGMPPVSKRTLCIAGIQVDIYGLDELELDAEAGSPGRYPPDRLSCLWLHHPRGRDRRCMSEIAATMIGSWRKGAGAGTAEDAGRNHRRGLIAVSFDQRNHGSRLADDGRTSGAWREGNPTHAQDMFAMISGTVADTEVLMDALGSYVPEGGAGAGAGGGVIDQHLFVGMSLGGHSGWQLMFREPRLTAAVLVVGCPDYMRLLSDRARLSKLSTWSEADSGSSFLGSRDFPPALIEACKRRDPKGILFGTGEIPAAGAGWGAREELAAQLDARVRGKRFLVCSGAQDKAVPYAQSQPFMDWFTDVARGWYRDGGGVRVEDRVYEDAGHEFSQEMVRDAVEFIVGELREAEEREKSGGGRAAAKI